MTDDDLTYIIRGCIFNVYNKLGPGLFESVYEAALCYELDTAGLKYTRQQDLPVYYDDIVLDVAFRIDVFVENRIVIEIKSVEEFSKVHYKQIITYLKLLNVSIGILVNFNADSIKENIKRIVNNYKN
jgi:GxxExxY protein